jgi:hypothetical protein
MSEYKAKILRHNFLISRVVPNGGVFEEKLNCPFTPDEFKVRGIGYVSPSVTNDLLSIHVEGLGAGGPSGTPIGSCMNPSMTFNGIIVPLPSFSSGSSYRFRLLVAGLPTALADNANLDIHLEFRKYL